LWLDVRAVMAVGRTFHVRLTPVFGSGSKAESWFSANTLSNWF
jgi:hypothetical protein